eukprot:s2079_g2.t1
MAAQSSLKKPAAATKAGMKRPAARSQADKKEERKPKTQKKNGEEEEEDDEKVDHKKMAAIEAMGVEEDAKPLKIVSTPFHEERIARPLEGESEPKGALAPIPKDPALHVLHDIC